MDPILAKFLDGNLPATLELLRARKHQNHSYSSPSDEPLGWKDDDGKLVTLGAVVMAIHVVTARLGFKTFPTMIRQRVDEFKRQLFLTASNWAAQKGGKKFAPPLLALAQIGEVFSEVKTNKETEHAIRRHSIRITREVRREILPRRRGKRKTSWVSSRHETPPQRRANKRWRDPSGT